MRREGTRYLIPSLMVLALLLGMAGSAEAGSVNLVTNGTFDAGTSGWDTTGTTTGVTWQSTGTVWIGAPGTPGDAVFSQLFTIASGTTKLSISFDFEWQHKKPVAEDYFTAELIYQSTSGPVITQLLNQGSHGGGSDGVSPAFDANGTFDPTSYSVVVSLAGLATGLNNGEIRFTLNENNGNGNYGTRIELDNVHIYALPEPSTLALLGSGLLAGCFAGLWRKLQ